jgi:hypothetical protein
LRFTLAGTGSLSTLEDGKMLIRNNTELAAYPSANGAVTLPGSITAIGYKAFYQCAALTSVSAPAVTSIGYYAFAFCDALNSVTLGATPPMVAAYIFDYITTACAVTVRIPAGSQTAYGVPNLPGTNFDNASTVNSWGLAFKGKGWNGTSYMSGPVNTSITLVFETYTP